MECAAAALAAAVASSGESRVGAFRQPADVLILQRQQMGPWGWGLLIWGVVMVVPRCPLVCDSLLCSDLAAACKLVSRR